MPVVVPASVPEPVVVGTTTPEDVVVGNKSDVSELRILVIGSESERPPDVLAVVVAGSLVPVPGVDVGTKLSLVVGTTGTEADVVGTTGTEEDAVSAGALELAVVVGSRMDVSGSRMLERMLPGVELLDVVLGASEDGAGVVVGVSTGLLVVGASVGLLELVVAGGSEVVGASELDVPGSVLLVVVGGSDDVVVVVGKRGGRERDREMMGSAVEDVVVEATVDDVVDVVLVVVGTDEVVVVVVVVEVLESDEEVVDVLDVVESVVDEVVLVVLVLVSNGRPKLMLRPISRRLASGKTQSVAVNLTSRGAIKLSTHQQRLRGDCSGRDGPSGCSAAGCRGQRARPRQG